jgi:hypothetical protein
MSLISPEQTKKTPTVFYTKPIRRVFDPGCESPLTSPEKDWPNLDSLVTEDDEPVDNLFSEKQQRLLTESLYTSWHRAGQNKLFLASANVGLFYTPQKPPIVPDVLVSLNVEAPFEVWDKPNRSYFVYKYGKPPEVAIEVVSNLKSKETGTKFKDYAQAKVRYYVIFDPENQLKKGVLRIYELQQTNYVEKTNNWLSGVGLGLTLWEGRYERLHKIWLRWCDRNNQLILTGAENTEEQRLAKEKAQQQAEQERLAKQQAQQQAKQERLAKQQVQKQAERLAVKLRAMGIDPDKLP